MKDILAANRYAEALLETVRAIGKDEEMEAELESLSTSLKDAPEIEKFLHHPQIDIEQKNQWFKKVYSEQDKTVSDILLKFITVLFKKNRFDLIHEISSAFKRMADEAQGQAAAWIKTSVPLEMRSEQAIVSKLERIAGCKIELKKELDAKILGGVVVRFKNKVLDGSVKNRIHNLKTRLLRPATVGGETRNDGGE